MAEIKLAEARELCTKGELELYQASRGRELKSQSPEDLQKNRQRARQQRDKWRDMAQKQQRTAQKGKGGRAPELPQRSTRKAQLFQEILDRIQAQIDAAPEKPAPRKKESSKPARTMEHRATRAGVRKQLQEKVEEKQVAASRNGKPKTASKTKADAAPAAEAVTETPAAAEQTPASKPVTPKRARPAKPPTPNPGLQADSKKQVKAEAAAKAQRVRVSGLTTRVRGHVSGRGKRAQAARNARKRT